MVHGMNTMLTCFGIGFVAGLRSMTAPAAVAFSSKTPGRARYLLGALALGELVGDKLPATPSRKTALPFAGRIIAGAISGTLLGARKGEPTAGLVAGTAGAVAGTLGGAYLRGALAKQLESDLPAALLEDALAIGAAAFLVTRR